MSDLPAVRSANASEKQTVVNTLTLAFSGDPFNRWYLPDSDRYLDLFPKIVDALLDPAIAAETCFITDACEGAAIWYPPGVAPDDAVLEELFTIAPPPQLAEELGGLLAAFEEFHPKDEDCWYLPLVGVDPGHQGKGLGGALMKHANAVIDAQGALSYLESSTPQNISLYERHGFESIGQLPFDEGRRVATPMVRSRRT